MTNLKCLLQKLVKYTLKIANMFNTLKLLLKTIMSVLSIYIKLDKPRQQELDSTYKGINCSIWQINDRKLTYYKISKIIPPTCKSSKILKHETQYQSIP